MKDELLRKIEATLTDGVTTEAAVVYLLVEIRKLMDRDGSSERTIKSFSNWVVHHELDGLESTRDLFKEFDDVVRSDIEENTRLLCPPHSSFGHFRKMLDDFLSKYNLPAKVVESEKKWLQFVRLYSAVVSDCPIRVKSKDLKLQLKYVEEIKLERPDGLVRTTPLEFLEWQVTLKDGETRRYSTIA